MADTLNAATNTARNVADSIPVVSTVVRVLDSIVSIFGQTEKLNGPKINKIAEKLIPDQVAKLRQIIPANKWATFDAAVPGRIGEMAKANWSSQLANPQYSKGLGRLGVAGYPRDTTDGVGYNAFEQPIGDRTASAIWAVYQTVLWDVKLDSRYGGEVQQRIQNAQRAVILPGLQSAATAAGVELDLERDDGSASGSDTDASDGSGAKVASWWSNLPTWIQVGVAIALVAALFSWLSKGKG